MAALSTSAVAQDILSRIKADDESQDDWRACGGDVFASLQRCVQHIEGRDLCDSLVQDLYRLMDLAQDAIKSVHHSKVDRKWRRLYTDVCILKGVMVKTNVIDIDRQTSILDAIKDLDTAIIVCGAPGPDRLEMIHQLIASLQKELPLPTGCIADNSSSSPEVRRNCQEPPAFCLASKVVKELPSMPSLADYLNKSYAEPFVVRNFASSWPAIEDERHNWANGSYLARVGGPGRVVPVEIGWQYTEADWHQDVISWQDFLEATGWTTNAKEADEKNAPRYLAQHNLFRQFPALESDIVVPDIVYSCPPAPAFFPRYRPPMDEDGLETAVINAWIGPRGTTTPAHFDPYYNAYVQVVGQKLVWVAPPDVFTPEDGTLFDGNSSTLPVFDQGAKDTPQSRRVNERAMSIVLGPGDLLVLPPGWFHAMRSLSRSFSVSMWY